MYCLPKHNFWALGMLLRDLSLAKAGLHIYILFVDKKKKPIHYSILNSIEKKFNGKCFAQYLLYVYIIMRKILIMK